MNRRLKILQIWVDAITQDEAKERVVSILRNGSRPHVVFASNPEKNFTVPLDRKLHDIYRDADILLPDGIGMVLAARLLYQKKIDRIPGVEFMKTLCRLAAQENKSVFVYGAKEAINQAAVEKLKQEMPGLEIAGRCNGYLSEDDMPNLIKKINDSNAAVLFLALGSPKQEKWFARYQKQLDHVVLVQGIGGSLDAITGNVKRASDFWCRMNLEWFYRLVSQPSRVFRQRVLPVFALQVFWEKINNRGRI